jgi:hypothetical protein
MGAIDRQLDRAVETKDLLAFKGQYPHTTFVDADRAHAFFSQAGQDGHLLSLVFNLLERNPGPHVFVDCGCGHPEELSNSLFFEKYLGFSVLAVDADPDVAALWAERRPSATFERATLKENASAESVTTLSALMQKHGLERALIASIKAGGQELDVLRGTDFDASFFATLCVRNNWNHPLGDAAVRDFLAQKDYVYTTRLGFYDDVFVHRSLFTGTVPGKEAASP